MRAQLEDYELRTGKRSEELDAAPPAGLEYLWNWFMELDSARSGSGFGANPLGWVEIENWMRLRRMRINGFELDCLLCLDGVRLQCLAEK